MVDAYIDNLLKQEIGSRYYIPCKKKNVKIEIVYQKDYKGEKTEQIKGFRLYLNLNSPGNLDKTDNYNLRVLKTKKVIMLYLILQFLKVSL